MLKNSIVYDNNIVNICFKVKAKKNKSEISERGGGQNILGMGGTGLRGGNNPLMGVGPPPIPPILGNPAMASYKCNRHYGLRT